jgi:hypothetical protein
VIAMKKTIPLLAIVALCAAAPAPAAAAKNLPRCAAKGSTTLRATEDARVYQRKSDNAVFACLYTKNHRVKLGSRTSCDTEPQVTGFDLAGKYVGWVRAECGLADGTGEVVLANLGTGQILRSAPAATPSNPSDDGPNNGVLEFVLNDRGTIAWIGEYSQSGPTAPSPDDRRQVRKLEAGSPQGGTLVDSGPTIVEGSLARTRTGEGFYYRKGTSTLFVPLGG